MDLYSMQQNFLLHEMEALISDRRKNGSFRNIIKVNDIM